MLNTTYEKEAQKELKKFKKEAMQQAFKDGFNEPWIQTVSYHPIASIGSMLGVAAVANVALKAIETAADVIVPKPAMIAIKLAVSGTQIVGVKTVNGIRTAIECGKTFDNLTIRQRT